MNAVCLIELLKQHTNAYSIYGRHSPPSIFWVSRTNFLIQYANSSNGIFSSWVMTTKRLVSFLVVAWMQVQSFQTSVLHKVTHLPVAYSGILANRNCTSTESPTGGVNGEKVISPVFIQAVASFSVNLRLTFKSKLWIWLPKVHMISAKTFKTD